MMTTSGAISPMRAATSLTSTITCTFSCPASRKPSSMIEARMRLSSTTRMERAEGMPPLSPVAGIRQHGWTHGSGSIHAVVVDGVVASIRTWPRRALVP